LTARFPNEPVGHVSLATLRSAAGDFLSAIPHARRAVQMDSLSLTGKSAVCSACDAYSVMTDAYISADSLRAAERTVRDWIRQQPSSNQPWGALATVLALSGQSRNARAALHE